MSGFKTGGYVKEGYQLKPGEVAAQLTEPSFADMKIGYKAFIRAEADRKLQSKWICIFCLAGALAMLAVALW